MYAYTHDPETGGLLLNDSTPMVSKEPRPVYYKELDILGFDKHWNYEKQDTYPYLWAEANVYWYRGRQVAKTKGGSLYTAPTLEFLTDESGAQILPDGETLIPVDIEKMVEKNRELIEVIEQITVKKIFDVYKRYKNKLDCFHVAFSGGKDSIVLLNLVKKALPKSGFVVVFGDTGMEFPDTYDTVDKVEAQCKQDGVEFYRASSHLKPEESWRLFGPPSRVLRWCCHVHKSTPQTLVRRTVSGKSDYSGMEFIGVRAYESAARSDYDYETFGTKKKGQHSSNPILEWTSAEIWLYIFQNRLHINYAYKLGNQRAGCVFCPMSAKTDYLKNTVYKSTIQPFTDIVASHYTQEDIENGYWTARANGTQLKENPEKCRENIVDDNYIIEVTNPTTEWREWIKTLGIINIDFTVTEKTDGYTVSFNNNYPKEQAALIGSFKKIFHKSAFCIGCRVCETNCRKGAISFLNGVHIDEAKCVHCQDCNQLDGGCTVYNSLKYPTKSGEKLMDKKTSIDQFGTHSPKVEWLEGFFSREEDYLINNTLGPDQKVRFKKFLRAVNLISDDKFTKFASTLKSLGWDSESSSGLMLSEFAYNDQLAWYIKHLEIDRQYTRTEVIQLIIDDDNSEVTAKIVATAYKRLTDLPIGTVINFGHTTSKGKQLATLTRTKSTLSDPRVVLYSLYKFAEACEGYYQFSLSRLLDHTVESKGISPTQIFGFDRDDMERFLNGLSANYPEFINATFTHDLDKIALRSDKTSEDVLTLF